MAAAVGVEVVRLCKEVMGCSRDDDVDDGGDDAK